MSKKCWTINVLRGLVIFFLVYLLAPHAALFFRNAQADPVIKAISLILILNALYNIGLVNLQKDLSFKKLIFYKFSGNLADFIVAVSVALILKNVWALICGLLIGHYTRLIVSYLIHPYRPTLRLDFSVAREIISDSAARGIIHTPSISPNMISTGFISTFPTTIFERKSTTVPLGP